MAHFNNARIRREAHLVSRQGTGLPPILKLFSREPESKRRETWAGSQDTEAQTGVRVNTNDTNRPLPVNRSESAPTQFPPVLERRQDEEKPAPGSAGDHEAQDAERGQAEQWSNGTAFDSQQSTQVTGSDLQDRALRQRVMSNQATTINSFDKPEEKQKLEKQGFIKHVEPKEKFTVGNQIRRTILGSWLNVLLLAAPVGIAINYVPSVNGTAVFVVNFIAIIPLAAMLSFATEEISLRTGETLGGLLNATFGNAVELIVAVMALIKGEVLIVQTSLLGSILSNLLLVMGMCFFFGGVNRREQYFNTTVAQTAASILSLALAGVIVPTVFDAVTTVDVAPLSRGTAVILLFVYMAYLFFQLKTHSEVFAEESEKVAAKPFGHHLKGRHHLKEGAVLQGIVRPAGVMGAHGLSQGNDTIQERLATPPDEEDDPKLHFIVALATLVISTVIIAFCAEYMVDGISAVTTNGVSQEFVGLILLPIVGNAAEHVTAVTVAMKDKMDLAIGVAVGSSMQVALLLIPLLVIIGWGMGVDAMTLSFDIFQVAVMFVAVLLVNYLIADGKSHWLEGMLLMCLYLIIAVCSWYYPATGVV